MRLDALTVAVRPRHPLEAADLGIMFAMSHAPTLARRWLGISLPTLLLLVAIEHLTGFAFTFLLVWWLKPLSDYFILWYLSRAAFGQQPGWRESLAAIPGFFGRGLIGALLWRRLSLSRSFLLPVWLLEGLSGNALRARVQVLQSPTGAGSRSQIQIFALFETIITLLFFCLLLWFLPGISSMQDLIAFFEAPAGSLNRDLVIIIYALATGVVEPLYVAAGFMLYLNRRAELEAWDVEIALRRLVNRLPSQREAA